MTNSSEPMTSRGRFSGCGSERISVMPTTSNTIGSAIADAPIAGRTPNSRECPTGPDACHQIPAPAITPTAISANASPSRRCAASRSLVRPMVRAIPPTPLASRRKPPRRPRPTARPSPPLCRRGGGRRVVDRDRPEPADRELDRERLDEPDLVDRVPLPPREPLPLEVFEAAVRFAILHTVVGLHHMSHFCHSGLFRDTSPPGPRRSGSAMLRTMVALFRSSTEPTRRGDTSSPIWQAMTLVDSGLVRLLGSLEVTGSFPPEMRNRPGLI